MQALTSPKISPTLFGERALCRLRPAASAHRRQAARARLRAAALLGPPHERPGSAKRCLSAPLECQDIDVPAAFRAGCACSLPQVLQPPVSTACGPSVNFFSQALSNQEAGGPVTFTQPPCLRLCSPPVNISPLPEPTSTRRTRDKVVLPHAPHYFARDAIPKIFRIARARDSHPQCPRFALSFALFRQVFSTPPLARPPHPRASRHGTEPSARCDVGCAACERCARRGCFCF